jgi:hypothetical protein
VTGASPRGREERLVPVDRQVVIILDLAGLRQVVAGLPPVAIADAPIEAQDSMD